jgi:hypothetical protein
MKEPRNHDQNIGERLSSPVYRYCPMRFARRPDGNLDILAESGEEIHKPFHRKRSRTIAHERRNMRLLDAKNLSGFGLRDTALPDQPVDLQRKLRLEQLLLGIGQAKIGKYIPAAFLTAGPLQGRRASVEFFLLHISSAFADANAPLQPVVAGLDRYLSGG